MTTITVVESFILLPNEISQLARLDDQMKINRTGVKRELFLKLRDQPGKSLWKNYIDILLQEHIITKEEAYIAELEYDEYQSMVKSAQQDKILQHGSQLFIILVQAIVAAKDSIIPCILFSVLFLFFLCSLICFVVFYLYSFGFYLGM